MITEQQRASMRAKKGTHFFIRVVTPSASAILEIPKEAENLIAGFARADFLHGATIYRGVGNDKLDGCRGVVAWPGPTWKGKK